jgi:RNA polymerase sigma-70 factor (ECF subfamily)
MRQRPVDFDTLLRKHKNAVYRQMVRMCGNQEDAEDVLAESLLQAYRAISHLEDSSAFQGWLAIIARRTCGRLKRREAMTPLLHLADLTAQGFDPTSPENTPEQQLLEAETKTCIQTVIAALPDPYREVYERRDVQGLSANEVAAQLGITVAAVKSRLHRARLLVREGVDASFGCSP